MDGVIVPIRDVKALAEAIECFCRDREFLADCSANALADRERLGLDAYQGRLTQVIMELNRRHEDGTGK
jgi:glycosyltransferase involved in cell wall biosynthesis